MDNRKCLKHIVDMLTARTSGAFCSILNWTTVSGIERSLSIARTIACYINIMLCYFMLR